VVTEDGGCWESIVDLHLLFRYGDIIITKLCGRLEDTEEERVADDY